MRRRAIWSLHLGLLAIVCRIAPCQGALATPEDCRACHPTVFGEWSESAHARAFVDPVFQRALATRREPERCIPCHAPGSALDRLGKMPKARPERRHEGVDCASCHVQAEVVHGPWGAETAAHKSVRNPAFGKQGSVALCSSCHDLAIADVLPLGREFRALVGADGDESCIGCHMESVRRAPAHDPATGAPLGEPKAGRSHRLLGPSDPEFCATAFEFGLEAGQDGARELVLHNGAGHGVPGLARLRRFLLRIRLLDKDRRVLHEENAVISWRNRLLADEERRWRLPQLAAAVAVQVQVDHTFADQRPAQVLERTMELP